MIVAAAALSCVLSVIVFAQSVAGLTIALVAVSFVATLAARPHRVLIGPAVAGWTGAYLAGLSLNGGSFDLMAPIFGVGVFLLIEVLHAAPSGLSVSTSVRIGRAVTVLTAIAVGGMTAVAAAWAGGSAPVSGPVAFAVATVIALALMGATVVLSAARTRP